MIHLGYFDSKEVEQSARNSNPLFFYQLPLFIKALAIVFADCKGEDRKIHPGRSYYFEVDFY